MDIHISGDRELNRDLARVRDGLGNQKRELKELATDAAQYAARIAPRRSGRLAGSIRGYGTKDEAVVQATAPYAGVINYGWPARNIKAAEFMQDTERAVESKAPSRLQQAVNRLIRLTGLS